MEGEGGKGGLGRKKVKIKGDIRWREEKKDNGWSGWTEG